MRLRWAMLTVMLFSMFNTLAGQPQSLWQHPETAIRGDGLSIHNETNHTFEFLLGRGWRTYLFACAVYFSTAFLIVSILPRTPALIAIFSFIYNKNITLIPVCIPFVVGINLMLSAGHCALIDGQHSVWDMFLHTDSYRHTCWYLTKACN